VPRDIDRQQVQQLVDQGAQLVEVLPPEEYEEWHLPGAINIPLRKIDDEARQKLDPGRPVIVYCWDDP
jgi:rhodanese-related sulfurtransferase